VQVRPLVVDIDCHHRAVQGDEEAEDRGLHLQACARPRLVPALGGAVHRPDEDGEEAQVQGQEMGRRERHAAGRHRHAKQGDGGQARAEHQPETVDVCGQDGRIGEVQAPAAARLRLHRIRHAYRHQARPPAYCAQGNHGEYGKVVNGGGRIAAGYGIPYPIWGIARGRPGDPGFVTGRSRRL